MKQKQPFEGLFLFGSANGHKRRRTGRRFVADRRSDLLYQGRREVGRTVVVGDRATGRPRPPCEVTADGLSRSDYSLSGLKYVISYTLRIASQILI